jgi:beta-glucosidase
LIYGTLLTPSPWATFFSKRLFVKENNSAFTYFIDGIPKEVPVRGYISVCVMLSLVRVWKLTSQLKTSFTPNVSGPWELGLGVAGQADLYINGEKVIDNSTDQEAGLLFVSFLLAPSSG